MRVRIREVFLTRTSRLFLAANIILCGWAITVIVLTLMVENTRQRESTDRFLNEHLGVDLTGLPCLLVSSGAQILAAALGILGSLTHQSSVLSSYRSLLVCSLNLKVFAFIWAGSLHPLPKLERYANLFKLEALYLKHEENASKIWKQPKLFWKLMQSELHCCGVNEFQDWIYSECKCIPMSCCAPSQTKKCTTLYNQSQITQGLTIAQYVNLKSVTSSKDCVGAVRQVAIKFQTSLILYALLFIVIDVILLMICGYLMKIIEHHMKKPTAANSELHGKFAVWLLEPGDTLRDIRVSGSAAEGAVPDELSEPT